MLSVGSPAQAPARKRCRREGSKWTRSGCLTCKRRRKRCDEEKPSCRSCVRLGLSCEGYGSIWAKPLNPSDQVFQQYEPVPKRRRIDASASELGSSPASTREPSSPCSTVSTCPSISLSSPSDSNAIEIRTPSADNSDFDDVDTSRGKEVVPWNAPVEFGLGILDPSGHMSNLSHLETHFLQYHMEQGSKLLANLDSDENPLRSLIIPRALSSPLLMKALCAVSAMHLANRSQDNLHAQTAAANYYIRTMSGIRAALFQSPGQPFTDDSILSVALLVKYEIVRGSVKQWATHLKALENLVISRGGFATFDTDLAEFLWGLFMYAHNLAKVTNRRPVTQELIPGTEHLSLTKLDSYIGYTEDIIRISARIADLPCLRHDPVALILEIQTIDSSLRSWTHTMKQYNLPRGITAAAIQRLLMVAECFRDSSYIHLHSILKRMSQEIAGPDLYTLWSSFVSTSKDAALQSCVTRLRSFPLDQYCEYSALTSPLFLVGAESEDPATRALVIESLDKLQSNFGIGNVKRAKEVLHLLWDGEMRHWLDVLEHLQWDLVLA
ncbi:C6 transcription factor [Aspergillus campestris IBT 28561]|uniref:C6 transcription factor n=1 Tax=Aspergillus campestris (strain IBT 28561) TaxID=1392248 RepID=A0A2I1CUI2_ASPC2|nr:C6 transcription factor [Aspergillus campestris IBT 28561]PKY01271.1 C6 transcription factor [Aspergillus campestris IBT 28561]